MKKLLVAGAFMALGVFNSAHAADLPGRGEAFAPAPAAVPVQGYNWTGFYAGLNAGYGWGSFRNGAAPLLGKPSGAVIGGQAGYNYQMNNFVIGAEGDLYWSGMNSKRSFVGPPVVATKGSVDWAGSLRARAGFAADRALVYATAGYTFAQFKGSVVDITTPATFTASAIRHGWTAGAGIEYAFTNQVSAKVEYLYSQYSSSTIFGAPYVTGSGITTSVLRAGVNYHF